MKFAIKSHRGTYFCTNENIPGNPILANRTDVGAWESYEFFIVADDGTLIPIDSLTPPAPTPIPPTPVPPEPTPVPPTVTDMIDVNTIQWVHGPDISTFSLATKLTEVKIAEQVYVNFDKEDGPNRWPDSTTPGWQGPLQYSMGVVFKINGQWYGCAPIELWYGLAGSGGPISSQNVDGTGRGQFEANWFYNDSWNPLHTHQPSPGEEIGFFVCAGDARNNYCPLTERSQIVKFNLPGDKETRTFTF